MNILSTLRKIRACEGDVAAQLVFETYVRQKVVEEREACAVACDAALMYNEDDPGSTFSAIIRSRIPPR